MGQKYFGSKAPAKVLVELTGKLVEMHLSEKTNDKVFKMHDLQHFPKVQIFEKNLKFAV